MTPKHEGDVKEGGGEVKWGGGAIKGGRKDMGMKENNGMGMLGKGHHKPFSFNPKKDLSDPPPTLQSREPKIY